MENKYWLNFEEWKALRDFMNRDIKLQEVINTMTPPKIEHSDKYEWDIMHTDNKYYVPTIEEFHVGFECERSGLELPPQWHKYIVNVNTFNEPVFIGRKLGPSFRVKYLDKEDIESLGFTETIEDQYYLDSNRLEGIITLLIDSDLFIQIILKRDNISNYLFQGTIKNKSELKVLLKQLTIC